jgi:hypothetical protein
MPRRKPARVGWSSASWQDAARASEALSDVTFFRHDGACCSCWKVATHGASCRSPSPSESEDASRHQEPFDPRYGGIRAPTNVARYIRVRSLISSSPKRFGPATEITSWAAERHSAGRSAYSSTHKEHVVCRIPRMAWVKGPVGVLPRGALASVPRPVSGRSPNRSVPLPRIVWPRTGRSVSPSGLGSR